MVFGSYGFIFKLLPIIVGGPPSVDWTEVAYTSGPHSGDSCEVQSHDEIGTCTWFSHPDPSSA
jgi:hypothetical protein